MLKDVVVFPGLKSPAVSPFTSPAVSRRASVVGAVAASPMVSPFASPLGLRRASINEVEGQGQGARRRSLSRVESLIAETQQLALSDRFIE